MRESFVSRTFSVFVTGPLKPSPSTLQQGSPSAGIGVVLPMQVASGTLPAFCVAGAGIPYSSVGTSEKLKPRLGDDVSSDLVFVRFQATIEVDVPSFVN